MSGKKKKFDVYVTQINLALIAGKLQHILISHTKTVDRLLPTINYTYSTN